MPDAPWPAAICRAPGCIAPGEHEGMCGPHFWLATARERKRGPADRVAAEISPQYARLIEAYLLAADLLARLPERRWLLLAHELDVAAPVLRRVRTIMSIAAGLPGSGLGLDTGGQWRVMITDRLAACRALEQAAMSTHYWRQAISHLLSAETAIR